MHPVSKTDINHLSLLRENVIIFTEKFISSLIPTDIVLEIGPQTIGGISSKTNNTIHTLDINENNGPDIVGDICTYNKHIPDNFYDKILCTEVLEHTKNPFSAVDELYRILKPKGQLWVSTPLNFRIHGPSPDCWRFTKEGLFTLFSGWSNTIIEELPSDRFLFPIQYLTIISK
jgi:SAM-dependent methyltransferase